MRNRYKKALYSKYIIETLGRNYDLLRQLCLKENDCSVFSSRNYEDIFEDTILFVSQDRDAFKYTTDKEIINHFCYRYRMIEYQTIKDFRQLKEIPYADYKQAQKNFEEE